MKGRSLVALILISLISIKVAAQNQQEENWITVFVHGTFGLQANFSIPTFFKLLKDDIECSSYHINVEIMRKNCAYYTLQPMQERGLHRVNFSPAAHRGPYLFSLLFNDVLKKYYNNQNNAYYTYGWSGLVSADRRFREARSFYQELSKEIDLIVQDTGQIPKVRLIGYSHGGSICLNLAKIRCEERPHDKFLIDELILLGMPVQPVTECLIHAPLFKSIYNIYSGGDHIQRLDIFSPGNRLSSRRFKKPIPHNLKQIEIQIRTDKGFAARRQDPSPGHIELWFFGWAPNLYRQRFSFYPLPTAIFIPYIIQAVNNYMPYCPDITMQIFPDHCQTFLKANCSHIRVPFLSCCEMSDLRQKAYDLRPNIMICRMPNNQLVPQFIN